MESNKKLLLGNKTENDSDCSHVSVNRETYFQNCDLFKCSTNSASQSKFHVNDHVKDTIYKCRYCTYQTVVSSQLDRHINSRHTKTNKYPCRYCHFVARSFISSKNHAEKKHEKIVITGKINSQNEQRITEVLNTDDVNGYSVKKSARRCSRIVKGEKFQCQYCEYQTPFSDYLQIHINSRHTQKILYKCPYCEYNATKSYTLKCHVNSKHTKKVVYKCELCNLETTRADLLKRHIERIHVEKSFNCQYCDYFTKKEGHLRNHLKRKHRVQYKTEDNNIHIKTEFDMIEIENIKFEPELVKSENV